ncbi:trigger factor [Emcibacter sp.]|uniref:trigger factor n=1 Tax=Emcibacter sp. TaxID=1979954 RepID=UPI002AA922A8|nr:trigger factor [Emcibacter sp.]
MQVTETNSEGLKRGYKVVISAGDIETKLNSELEKVRAQIKMPGFRPGKAPISLLKKLHGKNLMGQVLEETINSTSQNVLEEQKVRPATQPNIAIDEGYEEGKDLEYTMSLEIVPEFEIPDLSKLKLEKLVAEPAADQVKEALEGIAAQQKNYKKAAKTYKAAEGDAVLIDFLGKLDGVAFDGGAGEDFQLVLGSSAFIPGFEDQLIGVKAGDEKEVNVTFPENYQSEQLAGKPAVFEVTVKEVQKPEAAKVDDELATKLGLSDLAALEEAVKGQLSQETDSLSRTCLKRSLLDALADLVDFDVPSGMVDMEFEQIWNQLKMDMYREASEGNADLKPEEVEEPGDDVKEEYKAIAERRVRLGLLLSEIGQQNKVTVGQEEVTRQIAQEARRFPGQEKQVFEFYQSNPQAMAQVRAPLFEEKVVDFILEQATVAEKPVTRDDLIAKLEEDEAAETPVKGKKAPAKKAAAKKAPAKKAAAKAPAKKEAPKAAAEKKPAAKKAPAKKAPAKKAAAKKDDA